MAEAEAEAAGVDKPVMRYWINAAAYGAILAIFLLVRFPANDRAFHETAEVLPQGEGLAPVRD